MLTDLVTDLVFKDTTEGEQRKVQNRHNTILTTTKPRDLESLGLQTNDCPEP